MKPQSNVLLISVILSFFGCGGGDGGEPELRAPRVGIDAVGDTFVALRWEKAVGQESLRILRKAAKDPDFAVIAELQAGEERYLDAGLSASSIYAYRVDVVAGEREESSAEYNIRTADELKTVPAASTGFSAKIAKPADKSDAVISWTDASTNESFFEIKREDRMVHYDSIDNSVLQDETVQGPTKRSTSDAVRRFSTGGKIELLDEDLVCGEQAMWIWHYYRYEIRAVNAHGDSTVLSVIVEC